MTCDLVAAERKALLSWVGHTPIIVFPTRDLFLFKKIPQSSRKTQKKNLIPEAETPLTGWAGGLLFLDV